MPIVICPDLLSLTNGTISYSDGSTNSRPVDTLATYTCGTGYTLNGGNTRTCGSDGVWSGSAPTCQRKWNELCTVCLLSVFIDSHAVILICPDLPSLTKRCSDLPPLLNGDITYTAVCGLADSRPINTLAFFSCDNGYIRIGVNFRVCQSNGTWDVTAPSCQREFHYILTVASPFLIQ